jgi:hypothetical protein
MPNMVDINALNPPALTAVKDLVKALASPGQDKGDTSSVTLNLQVQGSTLRAEPAANGAVSYLDLAGFLASKLSAAALAAAITEWEHSEASGRGIPPRKPEAAKAIADAQKRIRDARPKRAGNVSVTLGGTITY